MKTGILFSNGSSNLKVDWASLLLRLVAGASLLFGHGIIKLEKLFSDEVIQFVDPFGIGEVATYDLVIFAEFFCAGLVVLGLLTRLALIPLIINMLVIVLIIHGSDDFGMKELPLIYLITFVALILMGPGKFSLDRLIKKRNKTVN